MTRLFLSLVGLAFAGSLLLVGCEPEKTPTPPTTPPKVDTPKVPDKAPTPPAVPEPKKTGGLSIPGAESGVAAVNATAKDVATITTCALSGCTAPGKPTITLVKDSKPLMFCCADCQTKYKKANNIQ